MFAKCIEILSDNLFLSIIVGLLMFLITAPVSFFGGLLYENAHDVIRGKNRRMVGLKKEYDTALSCVGRAEVELPDSEGTERFTLALEMYQREMGDKSLENNRDIVQTMFNLSTLKH